MSKSEFDDLLRKKITEEDLEYNPENWDRLSQLLPPALPGHSKKWTIGLGIAAALALLLATTLLIKLMDQTNRIPAPDPGLAARTQHEPMPANEPLKPPKTPGAGIKTRNNKHIAGLPGAAGNRLPAGIQIPNNNMEAPVNGNAGSRHATMKDPGVTPPAEGTAWAPGKQTQEGKAQGDEAVNSIIANHPGPSLLPDRVSIPGQQKNSLAAAPYDLHPSEERNQTSIAFGGGVNYGSLNAGYSLGITAQQQISNHFFFDGTVAIMYNNNTPNNIVNYAGSPMPAPANTAARPAQKMMLSAPAVAPVASLYYVQFNPSFGYQLADNLAVSVGGDLQQMLSRDQDLRKYQVNEDGTRVFPGLDLGFTGKTEYSITPQIQAGLIFREGLNNLIQPNQELPFVNRRYIQVQFKYTIPVRR